MALRVSRLTMAVILVATLHVGPAAADHADSSITLVSGWNLISLPLSPDNTAVAEALRSISGDYDLAFAYNASRASDPWRVHAPAAPPYANSLTHVDETMGIWVHTTRASTLSVSGETPVSTAISLYAGWNLVGYPSSVTQPISEALSSIAGLYTLVYAYDAAHPADPWQVFDPSAPAGSNTLTQMEAGRGYWIKASENTTLLIPPSQGELVTLSVTESAGLARADAPVTLGLPLPRALNIINTTALRLVDGSGALVPCQFTPMARWGGAPGDAAKPIRWLLLDFQADVAANSTALYRLRADGGPAPSYPTLQITNGAGAVTIHTGVAAFTISKTDGNLSAAGLSSPLYGRARILGGNVYTTTGPVTVTVKLDGPMRASVEVRGAYRRNGARLLDYTSRYWFYAGRPTVRLSHTLENNTPCLLGEWDQLLCHNIGSGGSITVPDVSLIAPASLGASLTYQAGGQNAPASGALSANLAVYQDSSGLDHWDRYPTFTDWENNPLDTRPRMQSYVAFKGYRTTLGAATLQTGDQAPGWLGVSGSLGAWSVAVRDFWQNFPKALRASASGQIEIGLLPDEFGSSGYGFNLRAGEHKTHEIWLGPTSAASLRQASEKLIARAPARWYVESGALSALAARDYADWPDYEEYVDHQLDTAPAYEEWMNWYANLPAALENTDFYGLFDYGDAPLDYEGYLVSPMNPKYHMDYGFWLQWLRSGDARWLRLAEAADRHIADIDILHNLHSPRHWGDGIMFGHSEHDEPGFVNPHRNANSGHPDTAFGAPGLLTAYYLTGDEKVREAALELADCIAWRLENDEFLCGYYPPGACNGQGYVLGEGLYDGNARPAANALAIVVAAYRATGEARYLTAADAVVRWARAADQPYIGGPTGGEGAIKPWVLNLYLRSLAEYLDARAEAGLGDPYDARGSYLAYADWLRDYAWLDLAPTETGPRAAYPYEWFFDGRAGLPDEDDNSDPSVNNWLLLGADTLAYAHRLSGEADYLTRAATLFRTGSRDPWYEDDLNTYSSTKETANAVVFGQIFLSEWAAQP